MDESVDKELPQIRITSVEPGENGQANLSFEVDDEFLEYIKQEKNLKEIDQETLSNFVREMLEKCSNEEDGYGYHKLKESDS
tara:strand:+ start:2677 stop:2922 length:246 start_codon:yes stop_codon:yes gene_type:complete